MRPAVTTAGAVVTAGALARRRHAPVAAAVAATSGQFVTSALGVPIDSHVFVIPVIALALYSLGAYAVVAGRPWLAGRLVRRRTDEAVALALRAQELERTQEQREQAAVAHERARIARELHDIVPIPSAS